MYSAYVPASLVLPERHGGIVANDEHSNYEALQDILTSFSKICDDSNRTLLQQHVLLKHLQNLNRVSREFPLRQPPMFSIQEAVPVRCIYGNAQ